MINLKFDSNNSVLSTASRSTKRRRLSAILLSGSALLALVGCSGSPYKGNPEQNLKTLLKENACVNCELSGVNLAGADLSQADLNGANLFSADLSNANLQGANLRSTMLSQANLSKANLQQANLIKISSFEANFDGANLQEADLSGTQLVQTTFKGANLSNANLTSTTYITVDFSAAILKNAKGFDLANIPDTTPELGLTLSQDTILPSGQTYIAKAGSSATPVSDTNTTTSKPAVKLARQLTPLQLRGACEGRPATGATPYTAEALQGKQRMLMVLPKRVKSSGERWEDFATSYLRDRAQWLEKKNPALLLCTREVPQAELIQTCPYEDGAKVERYYSKLELKLVETATGEVLATETLGQKAQPCYQAEVFSSKDQLKTFTVDNFGKTFDAEIQQFTQPFVTKFQ